MRGSRLRQEDYDIRDYQKDFSEKNADTEKKYEPQEYVYVPIIGRKINKTHFLIGMTILVLLLVVFIRSFLIESKNATQTHSHILDSSHKLKRVKFNIK